MTLSGERLLERRCLLKGGRELGIEWLTSKPIEGHLWGYVVGQQLGQGTC